MSSFLTILNDISQLALSLTLCCIARLVDPDPDEDNARLPQDTELVTRYIDRLSALWKILWRDRDIIFHHDFGGADGRIFGVVTNLLGSYFLLFKEFK